MEVTKSEIKFLINKYKKIGLKDKQIFNRLNNIFSFQEYITFKKKYL